MPALKLHEALVHHRRARREVGAETHAIGVGDSHATRHDVVGHPRQLVDAVHGEDVAGGAQLPAHRVDLIDGDRADAGPGHVGQHSEEPVEIDASAALHSRCDSRCRRRYTIDAPTVARRRRRSWSDRADRRPRAHRRVGSRVCDAIGERGRRAPSSPQPSHRGTTRRAPSSAGVERRPRHRPHAVLTSSEWLLTYITSGRSVGNRMTSLIESTPGEQHRRRGPCRCRARRSGACRTRGPEGSPRRQCRPRRRRPRLASVLVLESGSLLDRVVQLAVAVGQLAAVDEQLEPFGQERIVAIDPGQWRDLDRMTGDERRVDQRRPRRSPRTTPR